jgi:hypothetical protein
LASGGGFQINIKFFHFFLSCDEGISRRYPFLIG